MDRKKGAWTINYVMIMTIRKQGGGEYLIKNDDEGDEGRKREEI